MTEPLPAGVRVPAAAAQMLPPAGDEAALRAAVVAEARSWLRTPFHDCAGLKGVGTDCAGLPYGVYRAVGLVPEIAVPPYSPQFMMHSPAELYLGTVLEHAVEVATMPEPGDFVLWRFGRCFSHGAIVVEWPRIIHAHKPAGCVTEDDAERNALLARERSGRIRASKFFALRAWCRAPSSQPSAVGSQPEPPKLTADS